MKVTRNRDSLHAALPSWSLLGTAGLLCSGLAAYQSATFTAMPGDNGLSPTLKAERSCDIS